MQKKDRHIDAPQIHYKNYCERGASPQNSKKVKLFILLFLNYTQGGGSNPPLPIYVYLKEKRPWTQYRNSFSDIYLQKKRKLQHILLGH